MQNTMNLRESKKENISPSPPIKELDELNLEDTLLKELQINNMSPI